MSAIEKILDFMVEVGGCVDHQAAMRVLEAQGTQRYAELLLALATEVSAAPDAGEIQAVMIDRLAPVIGALGEPGS